MSFTIQRGLFKYDITDHYAILGIPVTSDAEAVRKQYLKLARLLHPDALNKVGEDEKQEATELLSKLINPAYETLKGKSLNEYQIVLSQTGKRLASEGGNPKLQSEAAKALLSAKGNIDGAYKKILETLASKQYKKISKAIDTIGEISELNMVYLMLKGGKGVKTPAPSAPPKATTSGNAPPPKTPVAKAQAETSAPAAASPIETTRRAQEYIDKNNFSKAILELRDALKIDPNNSICHSLLGMAYLKQNQVSMAKVHINKALQSNPDEPMAIQAKTSLEKVTGKTKPAASKSSSSSSNNKKATSKSNSKSNSGSGGMFGGLFGGKKKK